MKPAHHRLIALATLGLAAVLHTGAAAQTTQREEDFEAALNAARPQPGPAHSTRVRRAVSPSFKGLRPKVTLAPAGTIPPLFRSIPGSAEALALAIDAIRRGELDPYAYTDQVAGSVPLPAGARPMRCRIWGPQAMYTLGREAAPEVMRAMQGAAEEQESGVRRPPVVMQGGEILPANDTMRSILFMQHAGKRPENQKTLAEVTRFWEGQGFRASKSMGGGVEFTRRDARTGAVGMKLTYHHSSNFMVQECQRAGLTMPTGPYFTAELYFAE